MAKANNEKKEGLLKRIGKFFYEVRSELKKVVWLSRKELIKTTWQVLGFVFSIGALIWIFDYAASALFKLFLQA